MSAETQRRRAFPAAILYPARIHDLTKFGYTEELFPERETQNGVFS